MAKWYDPYLREDEKHKQIGQKGIIARRRKKATQANAQSISKAGYVSPEAKKKYYDTKARIAEQFAANKQAVKNMPSWEREKKKKEADASRGGIRNR